MRSSTTAPASPTTRNWIAATAGSSAAPSGSPAPTAPISACHRIARIRRDGYDLNSTLISKEIVHAITSLAEDRASAADLARIGRGQWGIESVHWDTAYAEDSSTGYADNGPRSWPRSGNLAISLLYLAGVTEITCTLQAIGHDRTRMLSYLPL